MRTPYASTSSRLIVQAVPAKRTYAASKGPSKDPAGRENAYKLTPAPPDALHDARVSVPSPENSPRRDDTTSFFGRRPSATATAEKSAESEPGWMKSILKPDWYKDLQVQSRPSGTAQSNANETVFGRSGIQGSRAYQRASDRATTSDALQPTLPGVTRASGSAVQPASPGRRGARVSPAHLRRARIAAKQFMFGSSRRGIPPRPMASHSWGTAWPPEPSPILDADGKYLPALDLSAPATSLAVQAEETRDGVATHSWWRLRPEAEPLAPNEEAGDYSRWTASYFARPVPRKDPQVPSWTEVLDSTLPRNRSMTLGQKKLFARTVEQLVQGNGVIKKMVGKSYVSPIPSYPKGLKHVNDAKLIERLPWRRTTYKPLIERHVD